MDDKLHIIFDRRERYTLHQQIERWLIAGIRAGHFAENERLPSIRELAAGNHISPNTVKKAYAYLERTRWIRTEKRQGVFIRYRQEERKDIENNRSAWLRHQGDADTPGTAHPPAVPCRATPIFETMILQGTESVSERKWGKDAGAYIRAVAARLLYEQAGMVTDADTEVMLFTGTERALSFVLRTLFGNRNNRMLVAGICSGQDRMLLEHCHILPVTITVNKNGIVLPHLTLMCKLYRPRVLLVDTSLYYMDAVNVDRVALENLLRIVREYDLLVIERNPDRELFFGKGRYPLLAALDSEHVIYLGTVSHLVEPLNRVKIIRAPQKLINYLREIEAVKAPHDGELMAEAATLLAGRRWRRTRAERYRHYERLREMVKKLLDERLSAHVSYTMPSSGLACWLYPLSGTLPENVTDGSAALDDALALRTDFYSTAERGMVPALYFAFGALGADELDGSIEKIVSLFA